MTSVSKAASAGQPAYPEEFLPLSQLTSRSARMGKWQLGVFHAWEDIYEYEWEGEPRQVCCLKALLVDIQEQTMYCHAEFKKTKKNEKSYLAAKEKYTEGKVFAFEKAGFVDSVKAQYQTATKREVINLASTAANPILGSTTDAKDSKDGAAETSAAQPCPIGSVADKVELGKNQHFDLIALVKEVSALRPTNKTARKVFDVVLIDGSLNPETGKMQTMKVALFAEEPKATEYHALAEKCMNNNLPVTFLNLQGSKEDDKFVFSSARKGMHMFEASQTPRARKQSNSRWTLPSCLEVTTRRLSNRRSIPRGITLKIVALRRIPNSFRCCHATSLVSPPWTKQKPCGS